MNVILREEVENLGNAGDVVDVKTGYACNYLIPRGLAVRADARNVKAFDHQRRALESRRGKLLKDAEGRGTLIDKIGRVVVIRSCGADGKLYGSVTNKDIAEALAEKEVVVDRRSVLTDAIKQLGDFDVEVKLGQGVRATLKVSVEPDAASAEAMAKAALAVQVEEADEGREQYA